MRVLLQRVSRASVTVAGEVVGEVEAGLLLLVAATHDDTPEDARYLADKCANLRIFTDADGKFNLSLLDVGGSALVVSQFTLYGDSRKGRRPSFVSAARPEIASPLVDLLAERLRELGVTVACGRFGANMAVDLCNDGPVTLIVDSPAKAAAG
jgi:D-tyrosyl-tRNA(Tyr) deacylase